MCLCPSPFAETLFLPFLALDTSISLLFFGVFRFSQLRDSYYHPTFLYRDIIIDDLTRNSQARNFLYAANFFPYRGKPLIYLLGPTCKAPPATKSLFELSN